MCTLPAVSTLKAAHRVRHQRSIFANHVLGHGARGQMRDPQIVAHSRAVGRRQDQRSSSSITWKDLVGLDPVLGKTLTKVALKRSLCALQASPIIIRAMTMKLRHAILLQTSRSRARSFLSAWIWQQRGVRLCASVMCLMLFGFTTGCGGLTVTRVNSAQERPNNVWVFFTVKDGEQPVGGLQAEDFKIYEDGKLVSAFESQQQILNPEVAAVSYTLLLLDMSGSVTESGGANVLVDAALQFIERVGKSQKVAVYAFDGDKDIHPVVPFTETKGSVEHGLEGLRKYKAVDPSTNLHGAVVEGLETLKVNLNRDRKPLKFGTLVVFSDGTDRAARVSEQDMNAAIDSEDYKNYELFAVGVGGEMEESTLSSIGRHGSELVADGEKLGQAFDRVAERIESHMKRFYLLSYCTPARAGDHRVRIVASSGTKKEGGSSSGKSGQLEYDFNADNFGPPPRCDATRKPKFKLEAGLEEVAEEPEADPPASSKK